MSTDAHPRAYLPRRRLCKPRGPPNEMGTAYARACTATPGPVENGCDPFSPFPLTILIPTGIPRAREQRLLRVTPCGATAVR